MANHGVVAFADTLHHAYMKMETVEHFARIALVTHLLGRQQPLGEEEVQKLNLVRTKYQGTIAAVLRDEVSGDHHCGPQPDASSSQQDRVARQRNKDFRIQLRTKN
jgi:ribulose-5-phosphate 4-epimerase/fuculose-1-phosphate aldolase